MKLIDLSLTVSNDMPGVSIAKEKELHEDGWNATRLSLYSHSGTHVDAPVHFGVTPVSLDEMPLSSFSAECWILDCTHAEPKGVLEIEDLGELPGKLQKGDGIIFKTGWSQFFGSSKYRDELPRLSPALSKWLVDKGVKLIGVEPPSVADVNNIEEVTEVHEILLGGNITIVEGLTNLDELSKEKVWVLAVPLKIKDGDGCPTRAIAIEY